GSVTMVFELASPGPVSLRVYDLSGRLIETPFDGEAPLGPMSCWLDGSRLPAGVYLARLQAGGQSATVRLVKL
ncbi:T9SS type A sorting domain-containing protein, partial [Candidatus Fermentibacterales bacterium]|nr:T9SS type A sorting domain-containing protein [Candidatus Fermentibacterales bacterium]